MKYSPRNWRLAPHPTVTELVRQSAGGNELLARALARRGLCTTAETRAFLDPDEYQPLQPRTLPEIALATKIINHAIHQKSPILVWGDFDLDGQTSTAILVSCLQSLGADVKFHVPLRSTEGHGIKVPVLQEFISQDTGLLITCDTGITANDAVANAKSAGVKVIITDHHQLPEVLPEADAIINPQTLPPGHPVRTLSGAGVAFLLASAILESNSRIVEITNLLDLAAMGLVADLVELKNDCRYLVQKGIQNLRYCQRPAIQELLRLAEINPLSINEEHISFSLAPRLNAIGRLGDANEAVNFLLSVDKDFLESFGLKMEKLNGDRKLLVDQVFKAAQSQIESSLSLNSEPVLILFGRSWPAGILGLTASRLANLYGKPAIVLTISTDGFVSGSARSVEGINLYKILNSCSDLYLSFGGHPMAAGLSIKEKDLPEFQRRITKLVVEETKKSHFESELMIEETLNFEQISIENVEALEKLAPFGPGNPPVIFSSNRVSVEKITPVGKNKEHLSIILKDKKSNFGKMIWWQGAGNPLPEMDSPFDIAYSLRTTNFKGNQEIQMEWVDWRESHVDSVLLQTPTKFEITDHRNEISIEKYLEQYSKQPDTMFWAEGLKINGMSTLDRTRLIPADTLVIVTIPPGRRDLQDAIDLVKPKRVILFAVTPHEPGIKDLLNEIGGMLKYVQIHADFANLIDRMAGRLNVKRSLVELSLKYLSLQKNLQLESALAESKIDLSSIREDDPQKLSSMIKKIIKETEAFREFYLRVKPHELFD